MLFWILLMVTITIAVISGVWNGIYWRYSDQSRKFDWGDGSAGFFPVLVIGGFISFFLPLFLCLPIESTPTGGEERANLKAITTDSSMSGTFFLASGTFDDSSVYKFIKYSDDGGYFMDEVSISSATVYDLEKGEQPYMKTIQWEIDASHLVPWGKFETGHTYKFYVPENSVVESYNIDVND